MSKPVEADDLDRMGDLLKWVRVHQKPFETLTQRDVALAEYGDHLFFAGHTAADFSKMRAAAAFFWRDVSRACRDLPVSKRAQVGFNKLAPATSRLPAPLLMVAAWASRIVLLSHKVEMGIAVMLMFEGYLRPCDALPLKASEIVPPVRGAGRRLQHWSLLLHPQEEQNPSKTGEYDEAIMLDNREFSDLRPALSLLRRRRPSGPVFTFSYQEFAQTSEQALESLGYHQLGVTNLYQLRHGGISHEVATGRRSLLDAQVRGRWKSQKSMTRYEKGGRIHQVLARLSPAQLEHAKLARRRLAEILAGSCAPY